MSHFVGLVFVNEDESNLDFNLECYNEQDEKYFEFEDRTEELEEKFNSLPEKDERLTEDGKPWAYPCDKEHYPTIEKLAEDWYGYHYDEDAHAYGYAYNPSAKWDWYSIGGRWSGWLFDKAEGHEYNMLKFDDVDWEKMFAEDWNHVPFCVVDTDGGWHEKGEMGRFAFVSNEKGEDEWADEVTHYVQTIANLPDEKRANIMVYVVDFHI